ncbi:SH3 domain-containing protein [Cytobacillus suaedae]|nr:SH3 domain-containing protein [Cytobacillus suaedae]
MYKNYIVKLLIVFLLVITTLLPYESNVSASEEFATINVDILNIRKGPGLSFEVVKKATRGEKYPILERKNDWLMVQLPGGSDGWLAAWLIKEDKSEEKVTDSTTKVESTVDWLRVRSGPGTSFQIVGHLNKGQEVEFVSKNENWVKVLLNGKEGWVSAEYLSNVGNKEKQNEQQPSQSITKTTGIVTATVLNVRDQASLQSKIVSKLKKDDKVKIVGERENWLEISVDQGSAWVSSEFIEITESTVHPQPEAPEDEEEVEDQPDSNDENNNDNPNPNEKISAVVTASILNVRDQGSLSGKVIDKVAQGDIVKILQENSQWCEVELSNNKTGWVASWYLEKNKESQQPSTPVETGDTSSKVKILHNGSNIRSGPSTGTNVVMRANEGDTFIILAVEGDWFKIELPNKQVGYIAGWIVETSGGTIPNIEKPGMNQYFKNKTIVIDPGHGGRDSGAIGIKGTFEKDMTLRTSKLLFDKLKASEANVVLTRSSDVYVSLRSRVSLSHYRNADAFISVHYDSVNDRSVRGITSYYYKNALDAPLAAAIQKEMIKHTKLRDRGHRFGNYHVLRDNKQPSVLLELGYLSNSTEELTIISGNFQENISNGIYYGLAQYFKNK